ncbi:Cycloeucalenol cycloisomerase [Madurella mycetomatis]|uniref:Cycloeucalenol cycloisomerase n=1 Tax=Madurella mycetomatis TaxID=100816 RepID=A0A175VUH8_9PEZI|nr:Cycloeucalenol cycloisomerase [Madurella mycetomatis]
MPAPSPKQKEAEKSQTHRLILAQSPLWILPVLLVMQTGILRRWSDAEYLLFSFAIASPSILLPYFLGPSRSAPGSAPYWLKLHVWISILVCFGTYFGTHYFFDLMGMRYVFATATWHLESDVVGRGGQVVPLFMYPLTHAYFMTYFVFLVLAEDRLRSLLGGGGRVGRGLLVVALAYGVAFAETYVMASPLLEDLFRYDDRGRMLRVGSLGYASYFVAGLPMVKRIDGGGEEWGIRKVAIEALATCMGIMILLEAWAKVVGPL